MAEIKKISTELQLLDKFLDTSGDAGASGQVLSSTGTGINWVSGSAIPGVPGGSGTLNTIPLWTPDGDTLGDSHITQNTNDIFIPRYLGHTGDGNNYIGFPANDVFNITTAGIQRFRVNADGNIGIGTTSPAAKLHVDDSVGGKLRLSNISATADGEKIGGIETGVANGTFFAGVNFFRHDANDGEIRFRTKVNNTNTDVMAIVDGNVGVGTTSPSANLDILNGTTGASLKLSATATAYWQLQRNPTTGNLNISDDALGNVMSFDQSTGNVGIGTTSPGAKLDVIGGIGAWAANNTSTLKLFNGRLVGAGRQITNLVSTNGNGSLELYRSDNLLNVLITGSGNSYFNGGNVGIGTTSPTNKLHIQGSQATVYSSTDSGGQASAGTTINNTNTAGSGETFSQLLFTVGTNNNSVSRIVAIRSGSDASDLAFVGKSAAGVAEYMRIKSGGNVGIGTTSPGSSLEVLKSASSTTISEARISSLVTGGYGGQANLWLRTSVYGSAMLAFGPQVGSSTVASSASGKISYNTFTRVFTVTADSNALLTLGGSLDRVGINQTSPLYTLDVTGNGRFTSTVTATNFINSSDKRLKENIEEVCNNNVEVSWKTFNFKTEKEQKRYGVIAQELEKTNPEFVREDSQGFKSVAYIDLLIAKIAELEARIQKLEK